MNKRVTIQSKDIHLNLDFHTCSKCRVWRELIIYKYQSWRKKSDPFWKRTPDIGVGVVLLVVVTSARKSFNRKAVAKHYKPRTNLLYSTHKQTFCCSSQFFFLFRKFRFRFLPEERPLGFVYSFPLILRKNICRTALRFAGCTTCFNILNPTVYLRSTSFDIQKFYKALALR